MWSLPSTALVTALLGVPLWFVLAFGPRIGGRPGAGAVIATVIGAGLPLLLWRALGWTHGVVGLAAYAATAALVWAVTGRTARGIAAARAAAGIAAEHEEYGAALAPGVFLGTPFDVPVEVVLLGDADALWLAPRLNASVAPRRLCWADFRSEAPTAIPTAGADGGAPGFAPTHRWRLFVRAPDGPGVAVLACELRGTPQQAAGVHNEVVAAQQRHLAALRPGEGAADDGPSGPLRRALPG